MVGTLSGPAATVFGEIRDIATDDAGNVYVLDSQYDEIRIFSPTLKFRGKLGGPGGGPRQFRSPVAVARDTADELVVADRANGIKMFDLRDSARTLVRTWRTEVAPDDICVMGSALFVRAAGASGKLIHEFDLVSGQPVREFADAYRSDNPLVVEQMSEGPIACAPSDGIVVLGYKYLPIVAAFDSTGTRRWIARIANFAPTDITETRSPQGAPRVKIGATGDMVATLLAVPRHWLLLQVFRVVEDSLNESSVQQRSYLIDARSGDGARVQSSVPMVLDADEENLYGVWGTKEEPWPRLVEDSYSSAAGR